MARPPRIEFPGAWHHVTARGTERRDIFTDDRERAHFCQLLAETVRQFRWRLHAYVLMDNHYHLLVETPEPNLGRGMHWLNVSYSVWFNLRHQRVGSLFQGRFKSVRVEPTGWALELSRYIHLNPVRVRSLGLAKSDRSQDRIGAGERPTPENIKTRLTRLRHHRWSSFPCYIGLRTAPDWLETSYILSHGKSGSAPLQACYRRYVEDAIRQGLPLNPWEGLRNQIILGSAAFIQEVRQRIDGKKAQHRSVQRLRARPDLATIIAAVEQFRGEKWQDFRNRHGDWGRDLTLYLARKEGGHSLQHLGDACAMDTVAVSMAVRRFANRLAKSSPQLKALNKCRQLLNV